MSRCLTAGGLSVVGPIFARGDRRCQRRPWRSPRRIDRTRSTVAETCRAIDWRLSTIARRRTVGAENRPRASRKTEDVSGSADWTSGEPPSTAVVEATAALSDDDPIGVPLLYDRIDPDALDGLFRPRDGDTTRWDGHLWFRLGEYGVSVFGDGRVVVRHLE